MKGDAGNMGKMQFWQYHVQQWQTTGTSKREYCRVHGLSYDQFKWWYRRIKDHEATQVTGGFVALPRMSDSMASVISIHAGGIRVEYAGVIDKQTLATVIAALKEGVCA